MFTAYATEISSMLFMAFALGLDGFSVSLGIGLQNIRLKRIAIIGSIIGIYHMILPFIGILIGKYISLKVEFITTVIGGLILVTIGSHMLFSALQTKSPINIHPKGFQLISLAFIVSLDSFPVGISLGLVGIKTLFIIFLFGIVTTCLAWTGMLIGKKANNLLGIYSEMLGGIILFFFGIKMIFY